MSEPKTVPTMLPLPPMALELSFIVCSVCGSRRKQDLTAWGRLKLEACDFQFPKDSSKNEPMDLLPIGMPQLAEYLEFHVPQSEEQND